MKIAILIADSYGEPFEEIRNSCLNRIWNYENSKIEIFTMIGKRENKFSKVMNLTSNSLKYSRFWPLQRVLDKITLVKYKFKLPKVNQVENILLVDISEGLRYLGPKFLASIQHLYDSGYDVIYKTTLSSVVQVEKLAEIVFKSDSYSMLYAGSVIEVGERRFVSGANLALNRQTLKLIRNKYYQWDLADYDDVALGKIARANNISITEISTLNIESLAKLNRYSDSELREIVHFRCKSIANPRNDIEIIDALLDRLAKINEK